MTPTTMIPTTTSNSRQPWQFRSFEQVYLIHFDTPLGHAKHYIGTAKNTDSRFFAHRQGKGARILQVCNELRIGYQMVRFWIGGRKLERKLKKGKNSPLLCPVCNPEGWQKRANY